MRAPAVAVLVAALVSGCAGGGTPSAPATGPVTLPSAGPVDAAAAAVCARVVAALPPDLGGHPRRPVQPDDRLGAAWGDPALTVACGGRTPDPTDEQVQLGPPEGGLVTFASRPVTGGTAYTTVGLPVPLTVTVPDAYDSTLLVPVTGPLLAQDR